MLASRVTRCVVALAFAVLAMPVAAPAQTERARVQWTYPDPLNPVGGLAVTVFDDQSRALSYPPVGCTPGTLGCATPIPAAHIESLSSFPSPSVRLLDDAPAGQRRFHVGVCYSAPGGAAPLSGQVTLTDPDGGVRPFPFTAAPSEEFVAGSTPAGSTALEGLPGFGCAFRFTPVPSFVCSDGADNDGDGLVDHPSDPGCTGPQDDDERDCRRAGGGSVKTVTGTAGPDTLVGSPEREEFRAGPGQDRVSADEGNDCVYGEDNKDRLLGGPGDDYVDGGPGNDWVEGKIGNDEITGGSGADTVIGGPGEDRMDGGPGPDFMTDGSHGANTYQGGEGHDLIVTWNGEPDTIDCGPGHDTVRLDRHDKQHGCEDVQWLHGVKANPPAGEEVKAKPAAGVERAKFLWALDPFYLGRVNSATKCAGSNIRTMGHMQYLITGKHTQLQLEFRLRLYGGGLEDTTPDAQRLHWGPPSPTVGPANYRKFVGPYTHTIKIGTKKAKPPKNPWMRRGVFFPLPAYEQKYLIQVRGTWYKRNLLGYYARAEKSPWTDVWICTTGSPG